MATEINPVKTCPAADDGDRLLTRNEFAELAGIKSQTAAKWVCRGFGPPIVKLGATVRYRLSDVREWIEEHTHNRLAM